MVVRNPAVLCKVTGFTVPILVEETDKTPLPHPLSLSNLCSSVAEAALAFQARAAQEQQVCDLCSPRSALLCPQQLGDTQELH